MEVTVNSSPVIAYFSMEVGLKPDMPTYSGGLGVLAAADWAFWPVILFVPGSIYGSTPLRNPGKLPAPAA